MSHLAGLAEFEQRSFSAARHRRARRGSHFLRFLLIQEILILVSLFLVFLLLASFNVWRFPLLMEKLGQAVGIELPAVLTTCPVAKPAGGDHRGRPPRGLPAAPTADSNRMYVAPATQTAAQAIDRAKRAVVCANGVRSAVSPSISASPH